MTTREQRKKNVIIQSHTFQITGDPDCHYFASLPGIFTDHDSIFSLTKKINFLPRSILDIGANIGLFSLGASVAYPDAKVYSYEPHPGAFSALDKNKSLTAGRIFTKNIAIGAVEGNRRFYPGGPINSRRSAGAHLMNSTHWKSEDQGIDVFCSTLDQEVGALSANGVDFIKIDVEGFEQDVLEGGTRTFSRYNPLIFMEFNSWTLMALKNINPMDFLNYVGKNFSHVYRCNNDGTLTRIGTAEERIRFLHDNLIHHGCVNDLVVCNSPDYFSTINCSVF